MYDFSNQRVLIVGGSSGIGAATARAFADLGAGVTLAARHEGPLTETARGMPGSTRTAVLDTQVADDVERFFADHGPYDHIVMSAARTATGPVRQLSLAQAQAAMQSKFWGAYHVARFAAWPENGGSLTLVSGFLAERPSAQSVLQGAINAALEALARGLALELAPIRVNAVSPGMIATPLWSSMADAERQAMYENVAGQLPVKRIGQPEDVAKAIIYLASTPFATGSTVRVDGGGAIA